MNASIFKMGPFCGPQHPITEPPHLQTFLCTKIKSWYWVCILFIKNEMQWYAYVWANTPKGRETALTLGRRPHFFVYRDRKLKFVMNIVHTKWSTMICCVGSFPQGPCSGPCIGPKAPLFLFIEIESWNLVCIWFIRDGVHLYAYVWVNCLKGCEKALCGDDRPT